VQESSEGVTTVETRTERTEAGRLLLRPEEVARVLGVGRTTVFELIRAGELRSVKIGKSRRISTEAVREYVAGLGG
jgi:excisionase family DNA binding protein